MTLAELKKKLSKYTWEPWLKRPFAAFVLSLFQDSTTDDVMKKMGINAKGIRSMLFQDGCWLLNEQHMKESAEEMESYLDKYGMVKISKNLDNFYKVNKKRILALKKSSQPVEKKLDEIRKILTVAAGYIWLTHSIEKYYSKKVKEEVSKYIKTDVDKFVGDASFPKKKPAHARMEDLMRAGIKPEVIAKKYGWLRVRDAYSDPFTVEEIKEQIKNLKPQNKHIQVIIPQPLKKLFVDLQELVYFRTARTDVFYELMFLARPIFEAVAKKYGINPKEINFYTIHSLIKGKPERYNEIAFAYLDGQHYYSHQPLLKIKTDVSEEIKGMVAFRGIITGRVKIVTDVSELNKVKKGDILVTQMTFPSFIQAMQKASAFVTDEGGITCHAAIISRELKKPCIIGTKNATRVLKDNDLVEVDAERGVVKILEKI